MDARRILNLPSEGILATYVGALRTMGMEKGIGVALKALLHLPQNVTLLLVGGNQEDVIFYKRQAKVLGVGGRVIFAGFVPHLKVPMYLSASDVLIAPFPKTPHYEFYMSPMKIFEYMASNRPIVASDLESIREIVKDNSAVLVSAEDAFALASGITKLMADKEKVSEYASNALKIVSDHSWEKRALRILHFLE
jgi:glycosyltransferase involved in cell wall biosynthesis